MSSCLALALVTTCVVCSSREVTGMMGENGVIFLRNLLFLLVIPLLPCILIR